MTDMDRELPKDPEERAFSGHPDHPPEEADQGPEQNQDLLRDSTSEDEDDSDTDSQARDRPGTTLPGYG